LSKEEDDLREFASVLEELAREAKDPFDLKSKLLSDASARLEDISAKRAVALRETSRLDNGGISRKVIRFFAMQWETLQYGPALSDPLARQLVDGLVERGKITVNQRRLINLYQMIRFQESGGMTIILPSKKSYKLSAVLLSLLSILLMFSVVAIWEVVPVLDGAFPISFTIGALMGFLLRTSYDFAWGREKTVFYVRSLVPWLSICRQE
jgi:hypothetical protein